MRQTGIFHTDMLRAASLWRLWSYLAINDLRGRFARTLLGYGWVFATFAIWAAGVGLVYARLFELDAREFVPFLTIGFALWGFITASFTDSSGALLNAAGYVKQFDLPKQVYVFRSFFSQLVTLVLTLVVCIAVVWICGQLTLQGAVLALPGLFLLLVAAILHAFFSAYLTPYVRDFPHAIGSILSVVFFLTPIIFPAELLAERGLAIIFDFNPFYYLIEVIREPLLHSRLAEWPVYRGALVYIAVLLLMVGMTCRALDKRLVYAL